MTIQEALRAVEEELCSRSMRLHTATGSSARDGALALALNRLNEAIGNCEAAADELRQRLVSVLVDVDGPDCGRDAREDGEAQLVTHLQRLAGRVASIEGHLNQILNRLVL